MNRNAKIVATIGPASEDEAVLKKLVQSGMDVARINFSHGTHDEHAKCIATIRSVAGKMGVGVGILQDLQGPKISRKRPGNPPSTFRRRNCDFIRREYHAPSR